MSRLGITGPVAIRAEGLGKRYQIGRLGGGRQDLRDTLAGLVRWPARLLRGRADQTPSETEFWALRDVSFEIRTGEVVGIIGRNGAGKSTLLKLLSRITEPSEGVARISGRVRALLEVGTGFHPDLTGRENTYLNGAILGMGRAEIAAKFDDIVAFAEIEKFIDTPVKHYSSGMYVRLAFAVAAHLEPDILLVDEVLAVGDSDFQKKCLGKMGEVGRRGRTVVLVSHNMASIVNLCERAILLDHGGIEMDGPAADVVQHYVATAGSQSGEVVWPDPREAPGDERARLHAVRVFQAGGTEPTGDVDIAREVMIELTYWNLRSGQTLSPAIWLRDQVGTVVFSSSSYRSMTLNEDEWQGRPYPEGLFRSVCVIPANLLNEGTYSVNAIVGINVNVAAVMEDYVISFQVHDTGEMRKEFMGRWIGVVRPKLAWHTNRVESGARERPTADLVVERSTV